jgi:hypothetical protein
MGTSFLASGYKGRESIRENRSLAGRQRPVKKVHEKSAHVRSRRGFSAAAEKIHHSMPGVGRGSPRRPTFFDRTIVASQRAADFFLSAGAKNFYKNSLLLISALLILLHMGCKQKKPVANK